MIKKFIQNIFKIKESNLSTEYVFKYNPIENYEKLKKLKDTHKNKRCFVIGNGPSLNKCDLTLLKNEYTFGVNGIFYKTDEIGFQPTFYMVEDNHVVADNLDRINTYNCQYKFFPSNYKDQIKYTPNTYYLPADLGFYRENHPFYNKPRFSKEVEKVIYTGQSVTIMNLQLAFYMGFSEVYLIGMDFSYDLPESTIVEGVNYTSQEDDVNHFHPDYFGKGKKWHDPKLDRVLANYKMCKEVFENADRKIINATVGGKLEIFERATYDELFK